MASKVPVIIATAVGCVFAVGCAGRPQAHTDAVGHTTEKDFEFAGNDAGTVQRDASARRKSGARRKAVAPLQASDMYFDAGTPRLGRMITDDDRQQILGINTAGHAGASGLVLHVLERGPNEPWLIAVKNEGTEAAHFVADTRLIWLEVLVPGAKKPARCRLPDELQPKEVEPRLDIELLPGEYVTQLIDPRLYCFASGDQKQLVPGARVVPHLGWPDASDKTKWNAGKKVSVTVPQSPPFVAHAASVDVDEALRVRTTALKVANSAKYKKKDVTKPPDSALGLPLPAGIDKHLEGPDLTLQASYADWSMRPAAVRAADDDNPLEVRLVQGSDARTEHEATVELTLHNRSKRKLLLYFRREFVTFEVIGPDGITLCNPAPDARTPDRSAFVSLAPGAKKAYASRLAEMCPADTFNMPGLYLVNGRYDATESGSTWNLAAYTGSIETERPANVRIRTGELSILHKVALSRPVEPGSAALAPDALLDAGVNSSKSR